MNHITEIKTVSEITDIQTDLEEIMNSNNFSYEAVENMMLDNGLEMDYILDLF